MRLWVNGPLPGLNEIIAAAKGARGTGRIYAALKKRWTDHIADLARAARLQPVARARFAFHWVETAKRRNPDNVAAARKFILDGLVKAGVLVNDGWSEIESWSDTFEVGEIPGCGVTITEAA